MYIQLFLTRPHAEALALTLAYSAESSTTTSEHVHVHTRYEHDDTHTHCLHGILFGQNPSQRSHTHKSPFFIFVVSLYHTESTELLTHATHTHIHVSVIYLIAPLCPALSLLLAGQVATGAAAGSICTRMREKPSTIRKTPFLSLPSSSASFDLVPQAQMVTNKRPCCMRILMVYVKECVGI